MPYTPAMSPRRRSDAPPGVQGELFDGRDGQWEQPSDAAPLAARMRPRSLDEFTGQREIVGDGRPLRLMVDRDEVPSIVLWGPPGTGKTTLASIIARRTQQHFESISAVSAGVADLRKAVASAQERRRVAGRSTILFIDELHRFNRAQQDVVLPHVENGVVTLIGATTENPSFYVVAPLLSRARVFKLELLSQDDVIAILRQALADEQRGLGALAIEVDEETLKTIAILAGGDARTALNILELAVSAASRDDGPAVVTREIV